MRGPPESPGQAECWLWLCPAHSWSWLGQLAPGSSSHSALVSTGTVTAWRVLECGAPSSTPSLPQPTTVPWVLASRYSRGSGRQIDPMFARGFTWKWKDYFLSWSTNTSSPLCPAGGEPRRWSALTPGSRRLASGRCWWSLGGGRLVWRNISGCCRPCWGWGGRTGPAPPWRSARREG